MKAIFATSLCSASAFPASAPKPVTTLKTPFGMPASIANSAILSVAREDSSDGFKTTEFPIAIAGANFQDAITIG